MISVIIPVYNTPKELKKCLESLAKQTFKDPNEIADASHGVNFEVIVVDDGSAEPVGSEISNFKFQISKLDIKFFRIQHAGAPRARNFGFEKSKGEFVLFCDADMELRKDCLAKMKRGLDENVEIDFVYSDFKFGWKKFHFWEFDADKLKQMNYINTCSMVRRDKVVKWDESLEKFQDWDFWLSIVERGGKGRWIPEVLLRANIRRGTMSKWLPKFAYQLPWLRLKTKDNYAYWRKVVREKHNMISNF